MAKLDTFRLTAAADVNLPREGLYLIAVHLIGAGSPDLPGAFRLAINNADNAHFPLPPSSNASLPNTERWFQLNHRVEGNQIPAGSMAFLGDLGVVELVFADTPNPSPEAKPLTAWRSVRFTRTDGGATNGTQTQNFPRSSRPTWQECYVSANAAARVRWPETSSMQHDVEATRGQTPNPQPVPMLEAANSLTLTLITDGAATIEAYVGF